MSLLVFSSVSLVVSSRSPRSSGVTRGKFPTLPAVLPPPRLTEEELEVELRPESAIGDACHSRKKSGVSKWTCILSIQRILLTYCSTALWYWHILHVFNTMLLSLSCDHPINLNKCQRDKQICVGKYFWLTGLLVLCVVAGLNGEGLVVTYLSRQHQYWSYYLEKKRKISQSSVALNVFLTE